MSAVSTVQRPLCTRDVKVLPTSEASTTESASSSLLETHLCSDTSKPLNTHEAASVLSLQLPHQIIIRSILPCSLSPSVCCGLSQAFTSLSSSGQGPSFHFACGKHLVVQDFYLQTGPPASMAMHAIINQQQQQS